MKFKKDGKVLSRKELKEKHPNTSFPRDIERMRDWMADNGVEEYIAPPQEPTPPSDEVAADPMQDLRDEVAALRAMVEDLQKVKRK